MIDEWCEVVERQFESTKRQLDAIERRDGRNAVKDSLVRCVRSHYDQLERIAEDVDSLGYPGAATILKERMPTSTRSRSGELGEIVAVEFVEFCSEFRIPVRRLRYKDGRDMALRGDDFIGIAEDEESTLCLLKGESKSRVSISRSVIAGARAHLAENDGRPTPISLLFVAERLLESTSSRDQRMGRAIRNEIALHGIPPRRITHGLFVFAGNDSSGHLLEDLENADESHAHLSIGLRVDGHQAFVAEIYEEAANLGEH